MNAFTILPSSGSPSLIESRALELLQFLGSRAPGFTLDQASEVIFATGIVPTDTVKSVSPRLRRELVRAGISIKHTHANEVSSRLLHGTSWHIAHRAMPGFLCVAAFLDDGQPTTCDWHDVAPQLIAAVNTWTERRSAPDFLHVRLSPTQFVIEAHMPDSTGNCGRLWPVASVRPIDETANEDWFQGLPHAVERLRRALEVNGGTLLDGVAAISVVNRSSPTLLCMPLPISVANAADSELVLLRSTAEQGIEFGYPIARGDELACWAELALLRKEIYAGAAFSLDEESGAWISGDTALTWEVHTLVRADSTPGLVRTGLSYGESKRLLKRFVKFGEGIGAALGPRPVKPFSALGDIPTTVRLDAVAVASALKAIGITWSSFIREIEELTLEIRDEIPFSIMLSLIDRLLPEDPNRWLARPRRKHLVTFGDANLLRALIARVDQVRCRIACELSDDIRAVVKDAVDDMSASIALRQRMLPVEPPLPDLVYEDDAAELALKLDALGLLAYAGTQPCFLKMPDSSAEGVLPYALGLSLYVEIDKHPGNEQPMSRSNQA